MFPNLYSHSVEKCADYERWYVLNNLFSEIEFIEMNVNILISNKYCIVSSLREQSYWLDITLSYIQGKDQLVSQPLQKHYTDIYTVKLFCYTGV